MLTAVIIIAGTLTPCITAGAKGAPREDLIKYGDWMYFIEGGYAGIAAYKGTAKTVAIPQTLGGKKVTILEGAFAGENCAGITKITIPNTVTTIGWMEFGGCASLATITIPASVEYIGARAFADCVSIKSIAVESGNKKYTSVDGVLFSKDKKTLICYPCAKAGSSYSIPKGVTDIGPEAFYQNQNLLTLTIPSGVTTIGSYAFSLTKKLKTITIPNGVKNLYQAFSLCESVTKVTLPKSIETIYDFDYCPNLANIVVSSNNKNFSSEDGVLFNKDKTTIMLYPVGKTALSYKIPSSVTKIGDGAFAGCAKLTSVTIPKSVASIGYGAFTGCANLKTISVSSNNKDFSSSDGVLFNKDKTTLIAYPIGKTASSVTIPSSVTNISDGAFANCERLTSVTFKTKTPPTIGYSIFRNCAKLKTIYVPAGAKSAYGKVLTGYTIKEK